MESFTTSETKTLNYKEWLCKEFTQRCRRNPQYSIRSFAKLLGMDSSSLSQVLAGKRKLSSKKLQSIIDAIGADPTTRDALLRFANTKCKKSQISPETDTDIYRQMTLDSFALISDWYHYALLELTFVQEFNSSPQWIAEKFGVSTDEIKIAIQRLIRLGLLEESSGSLKKTETFMTNFATGVTSAALKNYQKQILSMALKAIDTIPQEEKDITGITMAIDVNKLPEARKLIKNFRRELSEYLEKGEQTRVYQLGIQLFPLCLK